MKNFCLGIITLLSLNACSQTTQQQQVPQQQYQQIQAPNANQMLNNQAPATNQQRGYGTPPTRNEVIDNPAPALPNQIPSTRNNSKSTIQVSLLLDTSNSMDGLIEQAKSQLWQLVNELSLARDDKGEPTNLEIALYEYGNDNLSISSGYIRLVVPFTTDLDVISQQLFVLKTRGGSEYCGNVIQTCTKELHWTSGEEEPKYIFIAGNEEFTQGPVDYRDACRAASTKGIVINTIFCGKYKEGIDEQWKAGADCADGDYLNIDTDREVVHIDAPQDEEIKELNRLLNDTYIGYGASGQERKMMQIEQDRNAGAYGQANSVKRAISKSKSIYNNYSWDLVDAVKENTVDVEKMEESQLPEEMKTMSISERKAYVAKKTAERKRIQEKINTLSKERNKYVATKRAKSADEETLDNAMINTIRTQVKTKKYTFIKE